MKLLLNLIVTLTVCVLASAPLAFDNNPENRSSNYSNESNSPDDNDSDAAPYNSPNPGLQPDSSPNPGLQPDGSENPGLQPEGTK